MKSLKFFVVLLGATLAMQAQQQHPATRVEGFVSSDLAGAIPGAAIRLDSITSGYHRDTLTNSSGYYSIDELQPGSYSLCAEVRSYGCIIYPRVVIQPGERVRQDFIFVRAKRKPGVCEPTDKPREGK